VKTPPPLVVPAMKLVPVIVIVVSGDPAATAFGLKEVIAGPFTEKFVPADAVPDPFATVILVVATLASCVEVTAAVSCVGLT
jgi:hypothetical protein